MRRVASVGWLLLVGCNRIFGITATQPYDPLGHVVLTWQLATASPSGAPSPMLEYPPFAPGTEPQIRIAPLDGSFEPASFSTDPTAPPGSIEVPASYFDPSEASTVALWRIEYTLKVNGVPGAHVPHEVQWAPDDKVGHLVVPMVGRLDRATAPSGAGYEITTTHTFSTNDDTSVLTTGLWTTGTTLQPSGNVVDYNFLAPPTGTTAALSGAIGSPDAARGDRGFLVQYQINPDFPTQNVLCNVAVGSAQLTQLALTSGMRTAQSVTWDTARRPVTTELPDLGMFNRLTMALGALNAGISSKDSQLAFGIVPSTSFPGLVGSAPSFRLPVPVMQMLLLCPLGPQSMGPMDPSNIPATAQPAMLRDFPTAVHVQLVEERTVASPSIKLYSGMETVIAASGGGFKLSFPAAIPTRIALDTPADVRIDLVDNTDQIAIGAPTGAFTLVFTPETGVGLRADYHDVYLHRISSGKLVLERIYTVTAPQVRIDGSVFAPDADYVFEIRSYAGQIGAPRGDFAPVDYPYGSAVVFTRTFKTLP